MNLQSVMLQKSSIDLNSPPQRLEVQHFIMTTIKSATAKKS